MIVFLRANLNEFYRTFFTFVTLSVFRFQKVYIIVNPVDKSTLYKGYTFFSSAISSVTLGSDLQSLDGSSNFTGYSDLNQPSLPAYPTGHSSQTITSSSLYYDNSRNTEDLTLASSVATLQVGAAFPAKPQAIPSFISFVNKSKSRSNNQPVFASTPDTIKSSFEVKPKSLPAYPAEGHSSQTITSKSLYYDYSSHGEDLTLASSVANSQRATAFSEKPQDIPSFISFVEKSKSRSNNQPVSASTSDTMASSLEVEPNVGNNVPNQSKHGISNLLLTKVSSTSAACQRLTSMFASSLKQPAKKVTQLPNKAIRNLKSSAVSAGLKSGLIAVPSDFDHVAADIVTQKMRSLDETHSRDELILPKSEQIKVLNNSKTWQSYLSQNRLVKNLANQQGVPSSGVESATNASALPQSQNKELVQAYSQHAVSRLRSRWAEF